MYDNHLAKLIADTLLDGIRTYIRRATNNRIVQRNDGFRPSSSSARVVLHLQEVLKNETHVRQLVLAAVVQSEGDHRRLAVAMKEVVLDIMGSLRPAFVAVALNGLPTGTLRAKARRGLVDAARNSDDPFFKFDEVTETEKKVRGLEEILGVVPVGWSLLDYLTMLKKGLIALVKQVILEQCGLRAQGDRPQMKSNQVFAINADPGYVWSLIDEAICLNERAAENPARWKESIRWLSAEVPPEEIAHAILLDEVAFGEAEVEDFDDIYVAGVEMELKSIYESVLELLRKDHLDAGDVEWGSDA